MADTLPDDNSDLNDSSDTINQSQQDDSSANNVAEDAMHKDRDPSEDSEKGGSEGLSVVPQDEPDLVDRMDQMVSSGHIDRGAFDNERNDDDEESPLGTLDPDEDDSPDDTDMTKFGNHG
ncbi:hypothetical protein [Blastomonas aquatica]|uniref:Serine kinase/phosphatase n=1 Tax=Blastomonas aquatica TaxID=1510276 RepID=A0ABQ1JNF1_9SPHN|nr:hypothetical protein [Blastomonas aquatica]GGB71472.1 hypothetical protein GCM10010833_28330 [Blastomonas aquatica]